MTTKGLKIDVTQLINKVFEKIQSALPGELNAFIKANSDRGNLDTNKISDGYHTFGELYEHRIALFIALCKTYEVDRGTTHCWRSLSHSDGTKYEGWFILGMFKGKGSQITYHLPIGYWEKCDFAETLDTAPEFDGHTADDVAKRLLELL